MRPCRVRHTLYCLAFLLGGCTSPDAAASGTVIGNAGAGRALIAESGCATCHAVPGVAGASGRIGPALDGFGRRSYIAGVLLNTPPNLVAWLVSPQSIKPGNAMPNLGLSRKDAADMAAYLYTLK